MNSEEVRICAECYKKAPQARECITRIITIGHCENMLPRYRDEVLEDLRLQNLFFALAFMPETREYFAQIHRPAGENANG